MLWRGENYPAGCLSHDKCCPLVQAGWAAELAQHTTAKDEAILVQRCILHKAEHNKNKAYKKLKKSRMKSHRPEGV